MILIWNTNVYIFIIHQQCRVNHDDKIKTITQSMVYVELNRAPIPHPASGIGGNLVTISQKYD